jgi:hypothetical protein
MESPTVINKKIRLETNIGLTKIVGYDFSIRVQSIQIIEHLI